MEIALEIKQIIFTLTHCICASWCIKIIRMYLTFLLRKL